LKNSGKAQTVFDAVFGSALDAAAAIRTRKISSVELTELAFRRIDALQPKLNAYVYQLRESALDRARQADEAVAHDLARGPLHGVPINVKESFGVHGMPCTWGIPAFKNSKAAQDSVPVRRLREAGAILLGGTNVPFNLTDCQSFNDIYGISNNPWNLARTPGGSSGGSAASLAAGLAYLSIGSDIGGSIRGPAAFCGVYGHKPTIDIVNMSGHLPGGTYQHPGFSTLLAAGGPMARTAADLEAGLRILAGTERTESKAMKWTLPASRHRDLRDFRVGYILEDPSVPVSAETAAVVETAVRACERAGAKIVEGWPAGFNLPELIDMYLFMLGAFSFSMTPLEYQPQARIRFEAESGQMAKGALSTFAEWQRYNLKRLACRALWEKYFESFDVFLSPVMFTTAILHDHRPLDQRTVRTPEGREHSFMDLLAYITPASLTGCPATAAPAGLSRSGLPVGLQIMGAYMEDATPIGFAGLLANEIGGFQAPPEGI
jgi:amidase